MITSFLHWVQLRESENKAHLVIIYTNPAYRGADADSPQITNRPANATLRLNQLTMWENSKSLDDPKIAKWVNQTLLPELQKNKTLKPLVVWQNKQDNKNYVIDGNHRFLAYQAANWQKGIPVIIVPENEILVTDWTPQSGQPHPM